MTYRLVIFDFDGTLADSGRWAISMMNELARRHGFRELSDEEIAMLRGRSNREIVSYMKVPAWKMPAIAADFRRRMGEEAEKIALFEGVPELLQALKAAGRTVALVTSNAEDNARRILGAAAADIDDFECGASLFGKAKKFRGLLRRQGVSPSETICIGDETRDIEAAKAVGAASGAVTWGYATAEVLARFEPTLTFGRPEEIAQALG
jgi:phosphoglycolate phosphatase